MEITNYKALRKHVGYKVSMHCLGKSTLHPRILPSYGLSYYLSTLEYPETDAAMYKALLGQLTVALGDFTKPEFTKLLISDLSLYMLSHTNALSLFSQLYENLHHVPGSTMSYKKFEVILRSSGFHYEMD